MTWCQYLIMVHLGIYEARLNTRAATSTKFLSTVLVQEDLLLPSPDHFRVKVD
jgi:hypothetical protein